MRLPYRSRIDGPMVRATMSPSGRPQRGSTQERNEDAKNPPAHDNRRFDRSLMDKRNRSVCQFCPGVQTCSFAVHNTPETGGFERPLEGIVSLVGITCNCVGIVANVSCSPNCSTPVLFE